MEKQLDVFFSNQVEQLYPKLRDELFSSLKTTPFTKRTIVVPSPAMKVWLSVRFANDPDVGIAAGFKISYLDTAIHELTKRYCPDPAVNKEACSQFEMAVLIEAVVRQVLSEENEVPLWEPLYRYLQVSDFQGTKKADRRIVALSNKLAALFQQYEKYGCNMLREWEHSCNEGWQQ
jgi:exodeoxyribonuclease V gamma subunit